MTIKAHHTPSERRHEWLIVGLALGTLVLLTSCEKRNSSPSRAAAVTAEKDAVGGASSGAAVSDPQPEAGVVASSAPASSPREPTSLSGMDERTYRFGKAGVALLYVQEATWPSGDLWQLWACDSSNILEGRPGKERMGCMERVPGAQLHQTLHTPPSRAASVDVHTFLMGAQRDDPGSPGYDAEASADEGPPHDVTLSPFWIQRMAVSVRQFYWCMTLGPCKPHHVGTGGRFHFRADEVAGELTHAEQDSVKPVNGVTWEGARTYCEWIGGRLPTEAEWEYSARGGPLQLRYPWGDEAPTCQHAIYGGGPGGRCRVRGTTPVSLPPAADRKTAGQMGHTFILHQAGNVWEWTADWFAEDYYARAPGQDPRGPESGTGRVMRGGGWSDDDPTVLRGAYRAQLDPTVKMPDVGFRCAADKVQRTSVTMLETFDDEEPEGWTPLRPEDAGAWVQSHGMMVGTSSGSAATARWRQTPLASPVLLSVRFYTEAGHTGSVALLYGVRDADNYYRAELYPVSGVARIVRVLDGVEGLVAEATGLKIPREYWFVLNLAWVNGRHVLSYGAIQLVTGQEDTWSTGGYGLRVTGPGATTFDSVFTTP